MKKWVLSVTFACLILGLLLTMQLKLQNSVTLSNTDNKNDVLISLVKNNEAEIAAYETSLSELRKEYEKLTANASNQSEVQALQLELSNVKTQSGMSALKGSGIAITLDDNKVGLASAPQSDANNYVIHYQYILRIVNDLKRGGAEAISVNDQRLVNSSEIRCVGNTILINTTRLAPPFEIKAIGDVISLEEAINTSRQYENLRFLNFPVNYKIITAQDPALEIPAYSGSFSTKYMSAVELDDTNPPEEE